MIRGWAALAVVLAHAIDEGARLSPTHGPVWTLINDLTIEYLNLGRIGVVAFFCVSGYVIPFSFAHQKPVGSFIISRFFRLYPAYWLSAGCAVLVAWLVADAMPPTAQILANLTMVQKIFGQPDLVGAYWTLFYELMFYGMCLAAFVLGRLENPRYLLATVIVLSLLGVAGGWARSAGAGMAVPVGLFTYLSIMHLGTLTRLNDRDGTPHARRNFRIGLACVLLTAGPAFALGFHQHSEGERLIANVTSAYVALGLFFALRRAERWVNPISIFFGRISYSLYLFHPICLTLVVAWAHAVQPSGAPWIVPPLILIGSILLAIVVQRWVEEPSIRLGKTTRRHILHVT